MLLKPLINPLISMVIPVYNGGEYFKLLLDSIRQQFITTPKIKNYVEIVFSIDSPTDDSDIEAYKFQAEFPNNITIVNHANIGLVGNRNIGILAAHGEWLMWADHDDILPQGSFSRVIQLLEKYNPDIINFRVDFIDSDGKKFYTFPQINIMADSGRDYYLKPVHNIGSLWDNVIRRKVIIDHNIFSIKYFLSEDMDMRTKAYFHTKGKTIGVNDILYQWRIFKGSESHSDESFKKYLAASIYYSIHHLNYALKLSKPIDKKFWNKRFRRNVKNIFIRLKYADNDFRKSTLHKMTIFRKIWLHDFGFTLSKDAIVILCSSLLLPFAPQICNCKDYLSITIGKLKNLIRL